IQRPRLVSALHALQQSHGTRTIEQEILIHHEKRLHAQLALHLLHDIEELVASLVKVEALALAAKKRGRGAEIAAHRASDRWNDSSGGIARVVRHAHPENAEAEAGEYFGMNKR